MSINSSVFPPVARLAIRVGVTGHRPSGLAQADEALIRTKIREVLNAVHNEAQAVANAASSPYASDQPILRIISPLAEGADRLVAQEAIDMDFELQCPIPFARDEYEKDFKTAESRMEYRTMLAKATSVLELDGERSSSIRERESYEAVGRMVLKQCDVLIAIWDGKEAEGKGGTGQIVEEAILLEIPTIWIESRPPHGACLLEREADGKHCASGLDQLSKRIKQFLLPPELPKSDLRGEYFSETQPSWTLGFLFRLFANLITWEWKPVWPKLRLENFEPAATQEWQKAWRVSRRFPQPVAEQVDTRFRNHYAWADKLADYYGNLYRSSFVFTYLMGGLAVFFALFAYGLGWTDDSHPYHEYEKVWIISELTLILLIIVIIFVGNRGRWHERWMDYRLLAEHLRQMRFLMPLGRVTPSSRVPAQYTHGDPRNTWVNWHFRAIVREAGIVNARTDAAYLEAYRKLLTEQEIKCQVDYHQDNAHRSHRLHHRLHIMGNSLFYATLCVAGYHLFFHVAHTWATLLSAVFPAFGAAVTGIRSQGEFQRIAERSHAMSKRLQEIANQSINSSQVLSSNALGQTAEAAAEIMTAEVLDWRIVFMDKLLGLPS